jgi:hypothetical protein
VFEQYQTTTKIPELKLMKAGTAVDASVGFYQWENVVDGFDMPVDVHLDDGRHVRLHPTTTPQPFPITGQKVVKVDPGYYVTQQDTVLVP